jgi:hypothetical protein
MLNFFRRFFGDKRGDTNTIGWIVLIVFIILAVAPRIQAIGQTMVNGANQLNTNLSQTLGN